MTSHTVYMKFVNIRPIHSGQVFKRYSVLCVRAVLTFRGQDVDSKRGKIVWNSCCVGVIILTRRLSVVAQFFGGALCYKPEDRGFFSRWYGHNLSGRILHLGLTLPLIEMCTRGVSWG